MSSVIENSILTALGETGRPEAMINAMQAAGSDAAYEKVFEIVMGMEHKNFVKLVYCVHPNVINIQMTLVGESAYRLIKQK